MTFKITKLYGKKKGKNMVWILFFGEGWLFFKMGLLQEHSSCVPAQPSGKFGGNRGLEERRET